MTAEQQKLAAENMGLVAYVIKKDFLFYKTYFEWDDCVSIGYIGLCEAARDFKPERGYKFITVAATYIRNEIFIEIQKLNRKCRDVRKCATTFDQPIDASRGEEGTLGGTIPAVDNVETIAAARALVKWLNGQDHTDAVIIQMVLAGYLQKEITTVVGLSQSGISKRLWAIKERIKEYYDMAV